MIYIILFARILTTALKTLKLSCRKAPSYVTTSIFYSLTYAHCTRGSNPKHQWNCETCRILVYVCYKEKLELGLCQDNVSCRRKATDNQTINTIDTMHTLL